MPHVPAPVIGKLCDSGYSWIETLKKRSERLDLQVAANFPITGADMWGIMAKPPRVYASQRTK